MLLYLIFLLLMLVPASMLISTSTSSCHNPIRPQSTISVLICVCVYLRIPVKNVKIVFLSNRGRVSPWLDIALLGQCLILDWHVYFFWSLANLSPWRSLASCMYDNVFLYWRFWALKPICVTATAPTPRTPREAMIVRVCILSGVLWIWGIVDVQNAEKRRERSCLYL